MMKKKKKNPSNVIDIIYICILFSIMILLLIPKILNERKSIGSVTEPLTYCLYDESGTEVESWLLIIPDRIWVNDNGDCGTYSYKNGIYTLFLNDKKLCTAIIKGNSLALESEDGTWIHYYPKKSNAIPNFK